MIDFLKGKPVCLTQFLLVFAIALNTQFSYGQGSNNMTLLDNWDGNNTQTFGVYYNDIWGYVDAADNEYAIIGSPNRIHFIDVTNPSNISQIAQFTGGSTSIWRDFKDYDKYVYAVADQGSEGLIIFDMSALPGGNITKASQSNSAFDQAHNIYIDVPNGRLYVAGSDTRNNGLWVYDIATDPENPILINPNDSSLPGGYVHDIFVLDNMAYCSHGNSGLYIYDYSNANNPTQLANINTGQYNHSSWITEDRTHIVYAEENANRKLGLIDITSAASNSLNITKTFSDPLENSNGLIYHNPFIRGDHLFVSSYNDGVTVFDISDYNNPVLAAYYDTFNNSNYSQNFEGVWGVYPFFPSGTIIASDQTDGLMVLSTSLNLADLKCGNGVQDDFELGVDCGGFCHPCGGTPPPPTCPADLTISTPISSQTYSATNSITSSATIPNSAMVNFEAGNCIQLSPNFQTSNNATFTALIRACTPFTGDDNATNLTLADNDIVQTSFENFSNSRDDEVESHIAKGSQRALFAIKASETGNMHITLTNEINNAEKKISKEAAKGMNRFYIDTSDLESGWYNADIIIGAQVLNQRIYVE